MGVGSLRPGLLVCPLAAALALCCGSCGSDTDGAASQAGAGGSGTGGGGPIDPGRCGDGSCRLKAGENSQTCPADCGASAGGAATVKFFADFNSKAVEYGNTIRFTYVVWNEGSETAANVVLPVPVVQDASTDIFGARHFCDSGGQRYDCMVDLSYVPGSMRINRVYHPNRARNSYAFIDTLPLSDGPDGDEGYYDAARKIIYLTLPSLRPRNSDPENAGVVWSYELAADGGIKHTPCEQKPRIQNWNYVFADNAQPYMNDIIGHILCTSPRLRATVVSDKASAAAGDTIGFTITMSYDDAEPPAGISKDRFSLMRPRLYFNYPEQLVQVTLIDKATEAHDLPGKDSAAQGGGIVYWARKDSAGNEAMAPAESATLGVTVKVRDTAPTGSDLRVQAHVVSQNTLPYQDVDADLGVSVVSGPAPTCGDGLCTALAESAGGCAQDCPECVGEDGVTGLGMPPCCSGLELVRASYPYSWAYGQCYDWEGGGVKYVQGLCTHCGDGACKGKENACNCPKDCGPHCGNWVCEPGEDRASCPADC